MGGSLCQNLSYKQPLWSESCVCVCVCAGVREGEAADREEPAEGLYGWAVGELLLPVAGGVPGRPAEPRAGPVSTPLLPRAAARQLLCQQQRCPPAQACPQPRHQHHQHRPHHPLGLSHARAQFPRLAGPLGERARLSRQKWGRQRYGRPRHQLVHKVGPGEIQPDGNSRFLPGNDWKMYNWWAAKEGLY